MDYDSNNEPKLAYDIARCEGVGDDESGWREGCEHCLRRLVPGGDWSPHMQPPEVIAFFCEFLIEA